MEFLYSGNETILNKPVTENNFDEMEIELSTLCKIFNRKWININKNIDKELLNYISDVKFLFKMVFKIYGCQDLLDEMNKMLYEEDNGPDEDVAQDIIKHTTFLDNIEYVINCNDISEFKNDYSKVCISLKDANKYLKEKQDQQDELINSMKELNDKLETTTNLLESYLEKNK